ncbi:amino acid adenylation domain-containing protein, partial [Streptomyces sp. NPDC002586]
EHLFLICPGNPKVHQDDGHAHGREASYDNPAYVTILFSVFTGTIHGPALAACLAQAHDEGSFVCCIHDLLPSLDEDTIRRITRIVGITYEFDYTFRELTERTVEAPVTLFKAQGDDYSFIESHAAYSTMPPTVVRLKGDHYSVLKPHGLPELLTATRTAMGHITK